MEDIILSIHEGWSYIEFVESVRYTGYDPVLTRTLLRTIENNPEQLKFDVIKLIIISLERGTNQRKITTKISDEGRDSILLLISKYGIKSGVPIKNTDITLARVVSAFPVIASKILLTGDIRIVGDHDDLPLFLCHTAGASLIPHKDIDLYNKWKKWRISFSKVINSPTTTVDFDKIILDSKLYNETERKTILDSFIK
jgi:hypothetical protein